MCGDYINTLATELTWQLIVDNINIRIYNTVKLVCNDHVYFKIYYIWFIQ